MQWHKAPFFSLSHLVTLAQLLPQRTIMTHQENKALQYLVTHVFCPLKLPDGDDHSPDNDRALSSVAYRKACDYFQHIGGSVSAQWQCIVKMLRNLDYAMSPNALDEALLVSQIQSMEIGGTNFVVFT